MRRGGGALRVGLGESSPGILAQAVGQEVQVCQHATDKQQAQKLKYILLTHKTRLHFVRGRWYKRCQALLRA